MRQLAHHPHAYDPWSEAGVLDRVFGLDPVARTVVDLSSKSDW